ncbi:chloramphenicol phosphotransferase CPT family protein [Burkholderia sp. BE17]|uniref:chloramphenicol phosphotransferase CPT family protein n=1 Tax=Burkholderia sp. BE17 TaxID=2656644 RepID=UPI001D109192
MFFCALEVLIEREQTHGDRRIGLAESQFHSIHANRHYDYVVDSSSSNSVECGQLVPEWLPTQPTPAAFTKMHQQVFQ